MIRLKNIPKYFLYFLFLVIVVALFASLLIWGLSFFLWLTQLVLTEFGYTFKVSESVKTAVVTGCGAVGVAAFALFGIRAQNLSAESRHRMDLDLSLRKNICLEVVEAYAVYHQYLLKLASPDFDEKELADSLPIYANAFFKIHMVCTEDTIKRMLDANEEWVRTFFEIKHHFRRNEIDSGIDRLIYIQEKSSLFLKKVADFNIVARCDLKIPLQDEKKYIEIFTKSYEKIPAFLRSLK